MAAITGDGSPRGLYRRPGDYGCILLDHPPLKRWAILLRPALRDASQAALCAGLYSLPSQCADGSRAVDLILDSCRPATRDGRRKPTVSTVGPRTSSQHVSRVKIDPGFSQQNLKFAFEAPVLMVFTLGRNVFAYRLFVRRTYAECAISFLPREVAPIFI